MKLELDFGKKKKILEGVVSYQDKRSLVSGLLYVRVKYKNRTTEEFSNVYGIKTL